MTKKVTRADKTVDLRKQTEDEMRASEERYRGLLTHFDAGVVVHAADTSVIMNNPRASALLGLSDKQMRGKLAIDPEWKFLKENRKPLPIEEYPVNQIASKRKAIKNLVLGINRPATNDAIWVSVNGFPVLDNKGEISEIVISFIDITDRKRAEKSLKESEEKFRTVADFTYDWEYWIGPSGNLIYVSPSCERISGYRPEELMADPGLMIAMLHPDDREAVSDHLQELKSKQICELEFRIIDHDGREHWISHKCQPVHDSDGKWIGRRASNRDITIRKRAEEDLLDANKRLSFAQMSARAGIWDWDILTGKLNWSPELFHLFGLDQTQAEASFDTWLKVMHPDDRQIAETVINESISSHKPLFNEYRIIQPTGVMRWIVALGNTVYDEQGKAIRMSGICLDNNDRKQVEEALVFLLHCGLPTTGEDFFESLARYLAQTLGMDYVCIDRLEGDGLTAQTVAVYNDGILECNVSYALKDTPCGEVVGKGVCCYPRGVRQLFPRDEALQELKAESYFGTTLVDSKGRQIGLIAVIGHNVLDDPKSAESLLKLVAPRAAGELERRRTEEELAKRESLLNKTFDVLPIGLWFADENGRLLRGNPAGVKIWGAEPTVSIEEYGVFKARRLPSGEEIAPDDWALAHTIKEGVTIQNELLEIDAFDGQKRIVINYTAPVLDDKGNLLGAIVVNNDITAQKYAEEEKRILEERLSRAEKMEALGLLAGGVAHDLNNVLGIVVGYAELLLDSVDEKSPLRKDLATIFDGGQKAAAIVEDLLTLARRGVLGKKVLNLNKLIGDLKKSPQWEKLLTYNPHVQIKTDLDPDLLNISASSIHLEKTLYNLVSNASEAMTKGGNINIKTSNKYIDKPIHGYDTIHEGDYVVLSVSDGGDGISETDLKRIFEPFYTKKIMGRSGTGLGLSVVWGTVKDHQGYIDVQSEEGKGTTFTLYFLITREDIPEEGLAVSMSEYLGNEESILVVDDVKEQRDLAARLLTALNYKVSSVSSGEEAIKYLKDHQPELIVLDMIMDPGMDGLDTYKSVLEINPKQKAIIVSGFSESDRVKEAKTLGAGAYIKKPYIKEKLGLAVKKELERAA